MSFRSFCGTAMVLAGTFMYSLVRSREMDKEKAKKKIEVEMASTSSEKDVESNPLLPQKNEDNE